MSPLPNAPRPLPHQRHHLDLETPLPDGTRRVLVTVTKESRVRVRIDALGSEGQELVTGHCRVGETLWRMLLLPALKEFTRREHLPLEVREVLPASGRTRQRARLRRPGGPPSAPPSDSSPRR